MIDTGNVECRFRTCEITRRAALAVAEALAEVAESELAQTRAIVSCSEAMIQELGLEIAKLRRDIYGISPERRARLIDQLELQIRDLSSGFPSGSAALSKPHKQAGHMKATDYPHLDKISPCQRQRPHMNHRSRFRGILAIQVFGGSL